jgi:hypothetical protein
MPAVFRADLLATFTDARLRCLSIPSSAIEASGSARLDRRRVCGPTSGTNLAAPNKSAVGASGVDHAKRRPGAPPCEVMRPGAPPCEVMDRALPLNYRSLARIPGLRRLMVAALLGRVGGQMFSVAMVLFALDDHAAIRALHEVALRRVSAFAESPEARAWDRDLDDIEGRYLATVGEFLVGETGDIVVAMGGLIVIDTRGVGSNACASIHNISVAGTVAPYSCGSKRAPRSVG